jgi:hypothetical protein
VFVLLKFIYYVFTYFKLHMCGFDKACLIMFVNYLKSYSVYLLLGIYIFCICICMLDSFDNVCLYIDLKIVMCIFLFKFLCCVFA